MRALRMRLILQCVVGKMILMLFTHFSGPFVTLLRHLSPHTDFVFLPPHLFSIIGTTQFCL